MKRIGKMRIRKKQLLPIIAGLVVLLTVAMSFAGQHGRKKHSDGHQGKFMTMPEMVRRIYDVQEIKNIMSKHAYFHAIGKHEEEMETIWVQNPENQKTMSFGQNQGFWVGYTSIYDAYVTGHQGMWESGLDSYIASHAELADEIESDPSKYYGVGELIMHPLTTPIIEVAADGKTAKGTWYSPGQVTQFGGANWIWERYGVDFAKENGEWKIWHMTMYTDFMIKAGDNWYDSPGPGMPPTDGDPDDPMTPDISVTNYNIYSQDTLVQDIPFPVPYDTFEETFSYGPTNEQLASIGINR